MSAMGSGRETGARPHPFGEVATPSLPPAAQEVDEQGGTNDGCTSDICTEAAGERDMEAVPATACALRDHRHV